MAGDRDCDVLIAGAGPTGLVLGLWLARAGIRIRVVDKATEPGTTSRALAVQARTLEFYRQLGIADAVVERGLVVTAVNLTIAARDVGRVSLADTGASMTPYPYVVIYPQDEHERFLIEQLADAGVTVERNVALADFDDDGSRVRATLARADGSTETCDAAWIAGCDGAHSKVREKLATGFPGGTYSHVFYVADVEARGPMIDREVHVAVDTSDFLAVFPLAGDGRARLIGTVRDLTEEARERYTWDDVQKSVLERLSVSVERVNWFSTYRVHHRVTSRFRSGRAFLLGDAAHIHSPVGGQGMNTGIGDAVNLAWKLANVVQGVAPATLLDSYEPERIGFARRLVATTDRIFTLVTSDSSISRFLRLDVVPRVVPRVFEQPSMRAFLFRTVSQVGIDYRGDGLDAGRAGRVAGGDRLPWVAVDGGPDNFAPLASRQWQAHVYGEPPASFVNACHEVAMPLRAFTWRDDMARAGVARNAAYVVRPDGYVGLADARASGGTLAAYVTGHGLRMRA